MTDFTIFNDHQPKLTCYLDAHSIKKNEYWIWWPWKGSNGHYYPEEVMGAINYGHFKCPLRSEKMINAN